MQARTDFEIAVCDGLSAVGPSDTWNGLVDQSTYPNVFRRREWISTWWKWFGKGRRLYVLKLTRGTELVGVAPLYLVRTRLGGRRLAWIGAGGPTYPEYLGPIVHRDHASAVVAAIADHFRHVDKKWDCMSFLDVAPDDAATVSLIAALADNYPAICYSGEICPYFHLPESYGTLLKRLSAHGRQRKNRQLRRAKEELDARNSTARQPAAVATFPHIGPLRTVRQDLAELGAAQAVPSPAG